jgi:hypothetical protein
MACRPVSNGLWRLPAQIVEQIDGIHRCHRHFHRTARWNVEVRFCFEAGPDPGGRFYLPDRESMTEGVEPVLAWQYYSKRAQAPLNVAAALKQRRLGDLERLGRIHYVLLRLRAWSIQTIHAGEQSCRSSTHFWARRQLHRWQWHSRRALSECTICRCERSRGMA